MQDKNQGAESLTRGHDPDEDELIRPINYHITSSCGILELSTPALDLESPGCAPPGKGKTMRKSLALLVGLVICTAAMAQNTTAPNTTAPSTTAPNTTAPSTTTPQNTAPHNTNDPDQVVAQLQLWTQGDPDPVYYGEMTDAQGGHMACLEVAFIKYENHVLHYSYKMWPKHNGSCEYTDQTSRKVDNSPTCVADSEKPNPRATTTTLLTKQNINMDRSVYREMDFPNRRAGQLLPCLGQTLQQAKKLGYLGSAGIVSVKIDTGQFKMQSTANRIYRLRLQPTDPRHPPTDKVF
jgi:hypothetical protein